MYDVFISYSSTDIEFAQFLHRHLEREGLRVFLASVSLVPGQKWSDEIFSALNSASLILFLASQSSFESPWVQLELGAALSSKKKVIPVVWDTSPDALPSWVQHFQALNLKGSSIEVVKEQMTGIASRIKADRKKGLLLAGFLVAGLLLLGSKGDT